MKLPCIHPCRAAHGWETALHANIPLTDLERQVFILQAQRIAELEARIADLERSRRRRRKPSTIENATG